MDTSRAQYLKDWMAYYKYTIKSFAEHIGVTRVQVSRWVNGHAVVPTIVVLYCEAVNEKNDAQLRLNFAKG